jgi:hypothetical protein
MLIEGKVGPVIAADQTQNEIRQSKDSSVVVMDAHGRYQEAVYRGSVWSASNQAGQILTALATLMTGYVLYNPINSGKNLVLWNVDVGVTAVAGTATVATICLAGAVGGNVASPTGTTALNPVNMVLNSNSHPYANVYSTATFAGVTPVIIKPLINVQIGTAAANLYATPCSIELGGAVQVPPGAYVAITQSPSTTLLTCLVSMTWEEIPI